MGGRNCSAPSGTAQERALALWVGGWVGEWVGGLDGLGWVGWEEEEGSLGWVGGWEWGLSSSLHSQRRVGGWVGGWWVAYQEAM